LLMNEGWGELPSELLIRIMSYLDAKELAQMGNVNYHWKRVGEDDSLWKPLFIRDYKLPLDTQLKVYDHWIDEYKLLKFEAPIVLSENLRDYPEGLTHVSFSSDGRLFCTTAKDGSFKIWTATHPTYLIHERYLGETLEWECALRSQFSPDCKFLLVSGIKQNDKGEIAVFSIDADEAEVHFSSRVNNSPADVGGCWYSNSHLFSSDIFPLHRNSIVGNSVSLIWVCSAASPWQGASGSVLCPLLRILNQSGGYCQLMELGRYISTRLRSVAILSRQAILEHTTLSAKMAELIGDIDEKAADRSALVKKRLDALCADIVTGCGACSSNHLGDEDDPKAIFICCPCSCHEQDDRLLIYAVGESDTEPPHSIALKIIEGTQVTEQLHGSTSTTQPSKSDTDGEQNQTSTDDQLASIMSMFDFPDHVIDLKAHIMGLTLSTDQRYLYVNVTHDNYMGELSFDYLAEVRVINLSSMTFENSYFGHLAQAADRFPCSIGGHYVASASLDGGRVWSKEYHCPIGRLQHNGAASAVALSPLDGEMLVSVGSTDGRIKIWTSKKLLTRVTVPNDFM
uniref:F-box/WD repeat-containing protein 5 n=1 Tax=Toxocara canis TaxID=6265 RepID=A0A183TWP1_TOXCA